MTSQMCHSSRTKHWPLLRGAFNSAPIGWMIAAQDVIFFTFLLVFRVFTWSTITIIIIVIFVVAFFPACASLLRPQISSAKGTQRCVALKNKKERNGVMRSFIALTPRVTLSRWSKEIKWAGQSRKKRQSATKIWLIHHKEGITVGVIGVTRSTMRK